MGLPASASRQNLRAEYTTRSRSPGPDRRALGLRPLHVVLPGLEPEGRRRGLDRNGHLVAIVLLRQMQSMRGGPDRTAEDRAVERDAPTLLRRHATHRRSVRRPYAGIGSVGSMPRAPVRSSSSACRARCELVSPPVNSSGDLVVGVRERADADHARVEAETGVVVGHAQHEVDGLADREDRRRDEQDAAGREVQRPAVELVVLRRHAACTRRRAARRRARIGVARPFAGATSCLRVEVVAQIRVPVLELAQRAGLELADALARDAEACLPTCSSVRGFSPSRP